MHIKLASLPCKYSFWIKSLAPILTILPSTVPTYWNLKLLLLPQDLFRAKQLMVENNLEGSINRKIFFWKWMLSGHPHCDELMIQCVKRQTLRLPLSSLQSSSVAGGVGGRYSILTSKFLLQKGRRGCLYQERLKTEEWAGLSQAKGI